jgi:hypothetical protein
MNNFKDRIMTEVAYKSKYEEITSVCDRQGIEYKSLFTDGKAMSYKDRFTMVSKKFEAGIMPESKSLNKVENKNNTKNNILKSTAAERQEMLAQACKDFLLEQQNNKNNRNRK